MFVKNYSSNHPDNVILLCVLLFRNKLNSEFAACNRNSNRKPFKKIIIRPSLASKVYRYALNQ